MNFNTIRSYLRSATNVKGCTETEVSDLERRYNLMLPTDYREFLLLAGRGADNIWRGSDYTLDELPEIQEAAIELLSDKGLKLPDGSFVFHMHQGYQFLFVNSGGVFYYLEGNEGIEKRYDSFTEFFVATLGVL
jgi:hypothetical protein